MGCIHSLIYVIVGLALWRLWTTDYTVLWWFLFASAILTLWTAGTVRTAYRQALSEAAPQDEFEAVVAEQAANRSDVVRFWVIGNMVLTVVTLVLSVVGIVLSFYLI